MSADLELALRLADAADSISLPRFRSGLAVETKADQSPVTEADRFVESELRRMLAEARPDNPVGRKFDFLCQEFNREANTLCSKSADIELTRIGIDLKGAVERMREQVQNVE